MRVMHRIGRLGLFALVIAATSAFAKENYREPAFNADTRDSFAKVSEGVREQIKPGGRYEYVNDKERFTIGQKLDDMNTLFSDHDSVASMSQQDKIQLFNDQETVNSILTKRDGERVICKKEAPIGSHIPITTCHTYAQEQDAHKANAQQVDQWGHMQCGDSGHGMCGLGDGSAGAPKTK
jgi:hypothetical protein